MVAARRRRMVRCRRRSDGSSHVSARSNASVAHPSTWHGVDEEFVSANRASPASWMFTSTVRSALAQAAGVLAV